MHPRSTYVISLTPFDAAGLVDWLALAAHLERLAQSGVGIYVGGGGSGEAHTLSLEEISEVGRLALDVVRGRVPVRAMGREPRTAAEMIAWIKVVEPLGFDALQIYSPDPGHGYVPSPEELEAYFDEVLTEVRAPAVVSSHEANGYVMSPPVLDRLLAAHPQVVGVNVTSADITYIAAIIGTVAARAEVHVGGPSQAFAGMALGATGFLSSEGNLTPTLAACLVKAFSRGDLDAAADAYRQLMDVVALTSRNGNIVAIKALLGELGLPGGGVVRRPRLPLGPPDAADLARAWSLRTATSADGM